MNTRLGVNVRRSTVTIIPRNPITFGILSGNHGSQYELEDTGNIYVNENSK